MVIQNYRDIKARAARSLSFTPWDTKKLVLLYGAVPLGINLLLTVVDIFLNMGLEDASGLAGMQIYSLLATVSSMLSMAFRIFQIFWLPAILYCGLLILREQNPWPKGLVQGFRKWSALLRYTVLLFILFFAVTMAVASVSAAVSLPLMTEFAQWSANIPQTESEIMEYIESISDQQLLKMMYPMLIIYIPALIAVFVPLAYRARLTQLLILDEEKIGARAALRFSFALTKGSCLQMFRLDLSFWWYYLLLALCSLIPYCAQLPVFSNWNSNVVSLLCYAVYSLATLGVYMLGLMKINVTNAVAYDHLRTVPQTELPQLPEEAANG